MPQTLTGFVINVKMKLNDDIRDLHCIPENFKELQSKSCEKFCLSSEHFRIKHRDLDGGKTCEIDNTSAHQHITTSADQQNQH